MKVMKKYLLMLALSGMLTGVPSHAQSSAQQSAHVSYVLKSLKLKGEDVTKCKPHLAAYYKELAAVKADYKALKTKYNVAENSSKLTPEQCDQLFESKQKQDAGELALKKKYYALLKTVLPVQKAYEATKLLGDKIK